MRSGSDVNVYLFYRYDSFGSLTDPITQTTYYSNETSIISRSFISRSLIIKWQQCCADAMHCCEESLQYGVQRPGVCPRTWDGWSCWPDDVQPSHIMRQPCPKHIYWHQIVPPCRGYTTKECTSDGLWFNITDKEWSNYSMCARDDIYVGRIRYSIVTNVISMCTLIPALLIFSHYNALLGLLALPKRHRHGGRPLSHCCTI
ncbi:unnamed protein product [Medioppia subpectinata]|uniref:G-protein coupled receptors family 2 profile 1 domain-containing protein n=1 Tax=Medioppia subpectinata TaxID=1979941 RepID=A0A7R9KS48_9ACAR|nr:unnamed protein product [Medioppia subpectinata]CAG2108811.1 unnamed protein product [Medioppia subpectinata]